MKKISKEEYDKLIKENDKNIDFLESEKYEEIKRVENQFKLQLDKLKQKIAEKDQELKEMDQENNLLKSQIELLDNNITNSKQTWTESKYL